MLESDDGRAPAALAEGGAEEEAMASGLSAQGSQREAIRKMLTLNASSTGAEWDQATKDDSTWKVLIYDKYCRDIISPLFKVGQLKQMNVTLYMMLVGRPPFMAPSLPEIYDKINVRPPVAVHQLSPHTLTDVPSKTD